LQDEFFAPWQHVIPDPQGADALTAKPYWWNRSNGETAWHLEQPIVGGAGDWCKLSPADSSPYFWNRQTGATLHDFREPWALDSASAGDSDGGSGGSDAWERVIPADGRVYFWMPSTGHRQYEDPRSTPHAPHTTTEEDAGGGWTRVVLDHPAVFAAADDDDGRGGSSSSDGVYHTGHHPGQRSTWYYHAETGHTVWADEGSEEEPGQGGAPEPEPEPEPDLGTPMEGGPEEPEKGDEDDGDEDDEEDIWAAAVEEDDDEALALRATKREMEEAAKRAEYLRAHPGGSMRGVGGGPYAAMEGLSDDEDGDGLGGDLDESGRWGEAALVKVVEEGVRSEIDEDFEAEQALKRKKRQQWLFLQEEEEKEALALGRPRGSVLLASGSSHTRQAALHERFLRSGARGGGSVLMGRGGAAATASGAAWSDEPAAEPAPAAEEEEEGAERSALRREFLEGGAAAAQSATGGGRRGTLLASHSTSKAEEAEAAAAARRRAFLLGGARRGGSLLAGELVAERARAAIADPAVSAQGGAGGADAAAVRRRKFLQQRGGGGGGPAPGGGSILINRARALSTRSSRTAMVQTQLELEDTVDVLVEENIGLAAALAQRSSHERNALQMAMKLFGIPESDIVAMTSEADKQMEAARTQFVKQGPVAEPGQRRGTVLAGNVTAA
jgi:hypothetical protein